MVYTHLTEIQKKYQCQKKLKFSLFSNTKYMYSTPILRQSKLLSFVHKRYTQVVRVSRFNKVEGSAFCG